MGQGYLVSQFISRTLAMTSANLVSTAAILNYPVARSIIISAHKCKVFLPLHLNLYGPIISMHRVSHGTVSASLGGKCLYFNVVHFVC